MCFYYYLHYHHIPPCMRDIEYAIHYNFCADATYSTIAAHLEPDRGRAIGGTSVLSMMLQTSAFLPSHSAIHPCETLLYGPDHQPQDYDPVTGQAINNTAAGNAPSGNNHSHGTASSSSSNNNNNNNYYYYNNSCIASPTNTASSSSATVFDYNDPCATGGCLFSQGCGSGQCRLEQLGGRWVCCRCRRGGNTFRWCAHPMRRVPDTLCYHQVCLGCRADQGDSGQGQSS
ncbi:hypothetical protein PG988_013603 [Apiospora saccharicola]